MFNSCGIIHVDKNKISEEKVFELSINAGAKECSQINNIHEIIKKRRFL